MVESPSLPFKNSTLIYNPIAGRHPKRREKQIREVLAVLQTSGNAVKLAPTSGPSNAAELARAAVRQGDDLILVCGGDGTINEVINGIAPARVTLGILPGGTANSAGKELGRPHDRGGAGEELSSGSSRRIALGLATWTEGVLPGTLSHAPAQRYFLSVAGIGFDAYIIHRLSLGFKKSAGVVAYILESLRQFFHYSFFPFTCRLEDGELQATFAIVHRTSRYAGWLHTAPSASLFEPRFNLCFFSSLHRARYLLYAAAVMVRRHHRLRDVHLVDSTKLECVGTDPRATVYFEVDGELVGSLPAIFEIAPDALTLLVPGGLDTAAAGS